MRKIANSINRILVLLLSRNGFTISYVKITNMRSMRYVYLVLFLPFLFASCSKHAVQVNPKIEGTWVSPISGPNCGSSFSIDGQSKGYYYQEVVGLEHDGRAKIIDNELSIDGHTMLNILEIKDSSGIVPNYDTVLCFTQTNVPFNRILTTSNGAVWYRLD